METAISANAASPLMVSIGDAVSLPSAKSPDTGQMRSSSPFTPNSFPSHKSSSLMSTSSPPAASTAGSPLLGQNETHLSPSKEPSVIISDAQPTPTSATLLATENADSMASSLSDVETFNGKIVYNPDGSAYIIEGPDSDGSEVEAEISQEGSIIDARGLSPHYGSISFPQIVSAFHISRSSPAENLYSALCGQVLPASSPSTVGTSGSKANEVPVMHSYRVFSLRNNCKTTTDREAAAGEDENGTLADDQQEGQEKEEEEEEKEEEEEAKLSATNCSTVPVKPILMCFICKLSFGYSKSFVAHAVGEHHLSLNEEETRVLSAKNTSAIIQGVGKEKEPLLSFLKPNSSPALFPAPSQQQQMEVQRLLAVQMAAVASALRSSSSLVSPPTASTSALPPVASTSSDGSGLPALLGSPNSLTPCNAAEPLSQATTPGGAESQASNGGDLLLVPPSVDTSSDSHSNLLLSRSSELPLDMSSPDALASAASGKQPSPPPQSESTSQFASELADLANLEKFAKAAAAAAQQQMDLQSIAAAMAAAVAASSSSSSSNNNNSSSTGQLRTPSPGNKGSPKSPVSASQSALLSALPSVSSANSSFSAAINSAAVSLMNSGDTKGAMSIFSTAADSETTNLLATTIANHAARSTLTTGSHPPLLMQHSRNSCKTLKCPKCNWHYKYQETLEIHMKEKHPENEMNCIYCLTNQPHPRLARGETYTCGYKPYRCDVCNYSTTTKGNLSIHMQSDKHINNVQELQNGNIPATAEHLLQSQALAAAVAQCSAAAAAANGTPSQSTGSGSTPSAVATSVGSGNMSGGGSTSVSPVSTPSSVNLAAMAVAAAAQQDAKMQKMNSPQVSTPPTATTPSPSSSSQTNSSGGKQKATWRCDVCNYETNVARNLRIHMTSEKHTHNIMVLRQNVNQMQQISALQQAGILSPEQLLQFNPGLLAAAAAAAMNAPGQVANVGPENGSPSLQPEAALADMAYNHALLMMASQQHQQRAMAAIIQQQQQQQQQMSLSEAKSPLPVSMIIANGSQPTFDMEHPDPSLSAASNVAPIDDSCRMFHCCVCATFTSDSIEVLNQHIQCDRTRTRENEVLEFAGNSNICKLCSYKTNLKANFQLHCKTDKHIQRLQHVNHIKEGGLQAEWKLKFVNVSNPVQVRCNLCDYYTNSIHKLQLHTANPRHDARARIFSHLQTSSEMTIGTANKYYMCTLCNSATRTKFALLQHINSVKHVRNDSLHQLKQQQTGVVGVRDSEEEIREMFIVKELLPGEKVAFEHDEDVLSGLGSPPLSGVTLESADPALLKNALMDPATTAQLEVKLGLVDHSDQLQQQQQQSSPITCPVCPFSSSSEMRLQMHILTSHSHQSTSTGSDQASGLHSAPSINCPLCQEAFQEKSRLENHLVRIHNVNEEGFQKLMLLVDTTELDKFLAAKQQQQAKALLIDNSRRLASQADDDDDDGRRSECSGDSSSKLADDELIEAGKFLAGGNANAAFFEYLLCPSCNQMHLNIEDLFTHMNSEGHIKPILGGQYQCWRSACGQTFKSVTATQQHFKEQHFLKCIKLANSSANLASSAPVSDRHVYKYRCSQCSLAFKTYEKLELHMQYHLIRAATQCVICSRNFRSVEALQKHVETSHADMNEEELEQYKASLVSNQLLFAFGRNGGILDPSTTQLLKKESTRNDGADDEQMDTEDDAILDSCQATDDNSQPMDEFNSSAENTVNCAMNGNATENSFEDYLNSQSLAEDNYNDPNRKFKCHRCKVAFTRQSYLTSHNKTLLHRKGEKMSYPMEKYLDPNRPFKCEICKESFTQKNILLVHYNSVSHLHKLKQSMKESSAAVAAAASRGEPSDDQAEGGEGRTFKCNLCKVEYHQAAAFNSHLQSMAHKSRDSKFQELAITGQLDLSLPLIEHPETMEANNNNPCKANANELPSSGSAKHQPHHHQQQQHQLQLQQVNTPSGSPSPSKLQADMLANLSEQQQQALALQQAFNFAIAAGAQSSGQSQLLQLAGQSPFTCAKCGAAFISQEAQLQHQQLCGLFGNVQSIQANSSSANNNNGNNLPSAGNSQLQQQQQARQFKLANLQSAQPLCKSKPQLYKTLLETWGFEIVMQFNESNQKKKKLSTDAKPETEQPEEGSSGETGETAEAPLEKEASAAPENEPTDDAVPEINKCQCDICSKEFSSIWVLKAHREEIHKDVLPLDVVESFADEYRTEYERKFSNGAEDSEATENGGAVENGSASNHCSAESASGAHHTSQISPSEGNCDENTSPTAEQTASTLQQLAVGNGNVNSGTPPEMANFGQFGLPANASAAEIAAANQMAAAQLQFGQLLMSMGLAGMAGMPMPSGMNMPFAAAAAMGIPPQLIPMMMADPMMAAAAAFNNPALAAAAAAQMNAAVHQGQQQQQQQQQQSASGVPPPGSCSSPAPNSSLSGPVTPVTPVSQMSSQAAAVAAAAAAQQKRARTRISDDQLKVLRQYFDINNSPTEEQLIEMSQKSGLPMKVIKHWFRNTLFKERQRNKDSPYNFNNPPSTYLNIDEYEKTGEAKVFNIDDIKKEESSCTTTTIATATAETEQKETSATSSMKPKEKPAESESESESAGYLKNCSNEFKSSSSTKDTDYATSDDEEVKRSREPREHISLNTNSNSVDLSLNNLQKQQHAHLQSQLQLQKQAEFDHLRESMSLSVHSPQHSESSMSSNSESTSATTTTTTTSSLFANLSNFGPGLAGAPNMASSPLQFAIDAAQRSQLAAAAAAAVSPGMLNNAGHVSSHSSSGKRANRTRFTDYQIKVLQEFFESNAYPKDDDLEYLSKLLNLSPRVIVVWFQNARQKARKNYENQPASEPIETDDGTGRFQRTPGLNYQCKKCLQVFQRYYELIKHQKSSCFKDENPLAAQIRMAAERTNPTSPITAPRDTTTPIDCSRSATATPEKVTPLNMMASPGSVSTASPATSSTSSNHKSSPNVAENQPKFPCDKCTVVLKSYDQWKEHQIVHLVQQNTSLFNPSSSNPFSGLMGQFEGAQQSVSTHLPNSPQPMTISPSANIFSSGVKRKLTTTTDDEDDESHDSMSGNGGSNSGDQATRDKRLRTTILPEQLDYLYQKYQVESNPSRKMLESIAKEVGLKKRVVQVWFQNTRARERKGQFRAHQQVIHKRCPFCRALFKARSALESHLATRHADQYTKGDINIDSLPDGDPSEDGDNSVPESMDPRNSMDSNMADMVRQYYASCMGDLNMQGKDGGGCLSAELALKMKVLEHAVTQQQQQQQQQNSAFAAINSSSAIDFDQTPHPLQSTSTATTSTATATTPSSAVSSFFASIRNNSNGGGGGLGEDEGFDDSRSEEFDSEAEEEIDFDYTPNSNPSSPSAANPFGSSHSAHCSNSGNSHRGVVNSNSKRFRTQMTTVMLKAMKSIFADYKTPTMAECEALGREIGLAKRVVQVWFQNARAKEKKARLQFAKAFGRDLDLNTPAIEECKICNVKYSKHAPNAMQEHLFSSAHIAKLKIQIDNLKKNIDGQEENSIDFPVASGHPVPFSMLVNPHSTNNIFTGNGDPKKAATLVQQLQLIHGLAAASQNTGLTMNFNDLLNGVNDANGDAISKKSLEQVEQNESNFNFSSEQHEGEPNSFSSFMFSAER